jgi:CubicO group peptidase (beta-lactamase class C family)
MGPPGREGADRARERQVVPAAWLAGTRSPGRGVREAFAVTENEFALPGGWYRSQFWVIPGPGGPAQSDPVLVCLGIHGQLVWADRTTRTVVAKLSSWPDPQNTAYLVDTLRACAALAAHLAAGR